MEKNKNYIDKLYSEKFSKFETNISVDEWTKLSAKLSKVNFLKFSLSTFNIYFLSAIVLFAAAVTYLSVSYINQSNKIEKPENKIETIDNQASKKEVKTLLPDTFIIQKPEIEKQKKAVENKLVETKPTVKEIIMYRIQHF